MSIFLRQGLTYYVSLTSRVYTTSSRIEKGIQRYCLQKKREYSKWVRTQAQSRAYCFFIFYINWVFCHGLSDPLELELQLWVATWALGIKPRSSGSAVRAVLLTTESSLQSAY